MSLNQPFPGDENFSVEKPGSSNDCRAIEANPHTDLQKYESNEFPIAKLLPWQPPSASSLEGSSGSDKGAEL